MSCDAATPCDGRRNCWEATQSPAKAANGSGPPRKTPRTFLFVRFLLLFRNSFEYSGLGLTWYDLGKHHALQHLLYLLHFPLFEYLIFGIFFIKSTFFITFRSLTTRNWLEKTASGYIYTAELVALLSYRASLAFFSRTYTSFPS